MSDGPVVGEVTLIGVLRVPDATLGAGSNTLTSLAGIPG
jgi:hypothetical protein